MKIGLDLENLVDEDDDFRNRFENDLEELVDDEEFIENEDEDLELFDQSGFFENLFPQIMLIWDFSLTFLDNKR